MVKLLPRMFAVTAFAALPLLSLSAQNVVGVVGTFTNPIGGSNVSGVGTSALRWGDNVGNGQSGFDFFAASDASLIGVPTNGNPFSIGAFVHINQPIGGGSGISGARLNLSFDVGGSAYSTFFTLSLEETPNVEPCTYPSTVPCADRVTFSAPPVGQSFNFEGTDYFFSLAGFGLTADAIQSAYITQEFTSNRTLLWARITETDPSVVPEPSSLALLGLGLAGVSVAARRRRVA